MEISVVVPAYNAEKYLERTLDAVISQSFQNWELIIVSDGSIDSTFDIATAYAKSDPRIKATQQHNQGVAAARNLGFSLTNSNCEYVIFLDQDDLWETNTLEILVSSLRNAPSAVAAHGLSQFIDGNGGLWRSGEAELLTRNRQAVSGRRLKALAVEKPTTFAVLVYCNCIWTPGQVLIRRSALNKVGLFDPKTVPCDDWDMWLRLTQEGEMVFIDQIVLNFRRHDSNQSSNERKLRAGELWMRYKLKTSKKMTPLQRRNAFFGNRLCELHFARMELRFARESLRRFDLLQAAKYLYRTVSRYCEQFKTPHEI